MIDELRKNLEYNPLTGEWRWLRGIAKKKFKSAGTINYDNGRKYIKFKQKQYLASRLAWLYMTGKWPKEIDHIDRNPLNDKWSNLREVSHSQNFANTCLRNNETTGRFEVARD